LTNLANLSNFTRGENTLGSIVRHRRLSELASLAR
jgi:hypothetical protein